MCNQCHPEWVICDACEGMPDTSMFDEGFEQLPVEVDSSHAWQVAGIDEHTEVDVAIKKQGELTFVTEL